MDTKILGYDWEALKAAQQGASLTQPLPKFDGTITPSQYEKNEWSRMAQDAYAKDLNDIGHKFSGAASIVKETKMPIAAFDALQSEYREWLNFGWKAVKV